MLISNSSDNAYGRIFEVEQGDSTTRTVEDCIAACDAAGYTLAGLEFAVRRGSIHMSNLYHLSDALSLPH